jgi:hypothetical protein
MIFKKKRTHIHSNKIQESNEILIIQIKKTQTSEAGKIMRANGKLY